ncbi:MAG: hypothetical protein HYZ36_08090 [Pedosphaera parvula]|nr:hypothetical protein [Pedosphaera parvula]
MTTWKTKVSVVLMWLLAAPYIFYAGECIYALAKPGYDRGEQWGLIWIGITTVLVALNIYVSFQLLRRQRRSVYILAIVFFAANVLSGIWNVYMEVPTFDFVGAVKTLIALVITALLFWERGVWKE